MWEKGKREEGGKRGQRTWRRGGKGGKERGGEGEEKEEVEDEDEEDEGGRRVTGRVSRVFAEAADEVLGFGEEEVAVGGEVEEVDFLEDLRG